MGVRDALNRNPLLAAGATLLIIGGATWFTYNQIAHSRDGTSAHAFYTTDQTDFSLKSLFVDGINNHAPFMHNGKEAYLAHVFSCDGGKTRFIGFLEKFDDDSKSQLDSAPQKPGGRITDASSLATEAQHGVIRYVKKKGGDWVPSNDEEAYDKVVNVSCEGDGDGTLQEVFPK